MGFTKATSDYLDAGGIIKWITTPKTSAFTAVSGEGYLVDTTSAAITVTLPTSPSEGDEIIITDYASNAATNNITLDPGTLNLRGATNDFLMSNNDQSARLLYSGATKGWLVTSDSGGVAAPDLTVDYLVVAGGGSGASNSAGAGGAGGLRTSYGSTSGGGASAESSLNLNISTNYAVTIGAGAAAVSYFNDGLKGSNSTFSTISSIGGGGGMVYGTSGTEDGGSGGGGGIGIVGSGTLNQGFDGGFGMSDNATYTNGGGGGGASAAGSNATSSSGGNGGAGLSVSITGNATVYAGGGGGSGDSRGSRPGGTGGSGGGGNGGYNGANGLSAGSPNTGGGGGGNGYSSGSSAAGGSGIVILRYPDYYDITVGSGLTTGTLNTAVGSGEKYTTFTAGTGSITFGVA